MANINSKTTVQAGSPTDSWLSLMAATALPPPTHSQEYNPGPEYAMGEMLKSFLTMAALDSSFAVKGASVFASAIESLTRMALEKETASSAISTLEMCLDPKRLAATQAFLKAAQLSPDHIQGALVSIAIKRGQVGVVRKVLLEEIHRVVKAANDSLQIDGEYLCPRVWKNPQFLQLLKNDRSSSIPALYCEGTNTEELLLRLLNDTQLMQSYETAQILILPKLLQALAARACTTAEAAAVEEYARRFYVGFKRLAKTSPAGQASITDKLRLFEQHLPICVDIGQTLLLQDWQQRKETLNKPLVEALQHLRPEEAPLIIFTGGVPEEYGQKLREAGLPGDFPNPISKDTVRGCYVAVAVDDCAPAGEGYVAGVHATNVTDLIRKDPWGRLAAYKKRSSADITT